MAATDITFTGLWYLNGVVVSCAIAGLDCGDYYVLNGTIVVPITAHPQLSSGYIAHVASKNLSAPSMASITLAGDTYLVPVVIGRAYSTQGQRLRPLDFKINSGPGLLGHTRRGHQY